MPKKRKNPRRAVTPPSGKTPRREQDPINFDSSFFQWRVHDTYIDYDHPNLGWQNVDTIELLRSIITTLQSYEGLTWAEVKTKPHCHSKDIDELKQQLQNRLNERKLDYVERLFQICMGSIHRIWGYRERRVFYLMWYDPEHDVCPTEAR